jgi:hypothetical protein
MAKVSTAATYSCPPPQPGPAKHRLSSSVEESDFDRRRGTKKRQWLDHHSQQSEDESDEPDELYNETLLEQRISQERPGDIWSAADVEKSPDSYVKMVESTLVHLERHLRLCALCCS